MQLPEAEEGLQSIQIQVHWCSKYCVTSDLDSDLAFGIEDMSNLDNIPSLHFISNSSS